jgi:hypothetical protein
MNCKECGRDIEKYDNAFHKMCKECNRDRLAASKSPKLDKHITGNSKASRTSVERIHRPVKGNKSNRIIYGGDKRSKSLGNKILDEMFYEKCFNSCSDHSCEECGRPLPNEFRGDNGKILCRSRYSHIIAKSIAPELRHDVNNINHLCLEDHMEWEFGKKEKMKIYNINKKRLPKYFR